MIEPALIDQLLHDTSGADALPLLAFTLEQLFVDYGADGDLRLDEYNNMGGVRGSIKAAVKAAFAKSEREPVIPVDEEKRNLLLKRAFIPWLVTVDPHTSERKRRIACWDELPDETHPILKRLVEARLLLRDRRALQGKAQEVDIIEVAHEALLRQWDTLTTWLDNYEVDLKMLSSVQHATIDWIKNDHSEDWLIHSGERIVIAEQIKTRIDFNYLLGVDGLAYLVACRVKENRLLERTLKYELKQLARKWSERKGLVRLFGLAGWSKLFSFRGLSIDTPIESAYIRWSIARTSLNTFCFFLSIASFTESLWWVKKDGLPIEMALTLYRFRLGYTPLPELSEEPIPVGTYIMGEHDEAFKKNQNEITEKYYGIPGKSIQIMQSFYIGKYEITYEQFDYFVWKQKSSGVEEISYPMAPTGRGKMPVVYVNRQVASEYAYWLSHQTENQCRLPTEAEWEYAARAGSIMAYHWGNEVGVNNANCDGCGSKWDGKQTSPIGSFSANKFGLYDMSGNVREWTCSRWSDLLDHNAQECESDVNSRSGVVRGGNWFFDPDDSRLSSRVPVDTKQSTGAIGFRILCFSPIRK